MKLFLKFILTLGFIFVSTLPFGGIRDLHYYLENPLWVVGIILLIILSYLGFSLFLEDIYRKKKRKIFLGILIPIILLFCIGYLYIKLNTFKHPDTGLMEPCVPTENNPC